MSSPYIGEIRLMSFNFPPRGWAFCDGQVLAINQNQALFSLLGTMYGGNGQTTFALPDLRGRVPLHLGNGYPQGQSAGSETHTLVASEMPQHGHLPQAMPGGATQLSPAGNTWAGGRPAWNATPDSSMQSSAIGIAGGAQPHPNLSPFLAVSFCIALTGIFPSRN